MVHKPIITTYKVFSRAVITPCCPIHIKYHDGRYFVSYVVVNREGQEKPHIASFNTYFDAFQEMNTARMAQGYKKLTYKRYKGVK